MKRAFTLIELLVVISIIAILLAILSPVIVGARTVFQRYVGSNAMRQVAMMTSIYASDCDETLPPYRMIGNLGNWCDPETSCLNPDFRKAVKSYGLARAQEFVGERSRDASFYYHQLWPYGATERLFKSPGNPKGWVGIDKSGVSTDVPEFRSYGGQNNYGLNWYLFTNPTWNTPTGGGLSMSQIDAQSSTALLFDASYYLVLPRKPQPLMGSGYESSWVCYGNYPEYWKNIGNSALFTPQGPPTDEIAEMLGAQRWSGMINVVHLDQSSHPRKYLDVLNNLEVKGPESYWDPFKQGTIPCPVN